MSSSTVTDWDLRRGRAGIDVAKDADLKDRVTKLENILVELQSSGDSRAAPAKRVEQNVGRLKRS